MTAKEQRRELIATIIPNKANFDHIGQYRRINGSLLLDIERVMETYSQQQNKELIEENDFICNQLSELKKARDYNLQRASDISKDRYLLVEENKRLTEGIQEALKFLGTKRSHLPGLGAPITILKQALNQK